MALPLMFKAVGQRYITALVHESRQEMAQAAADAVRNRIHFVLNHAPFCRVIFACAPSQDEFLAELVRAPRPELAIHWSRVEIFHMDEYVGLDMRHPANFRSYLYRHLFQGHYQATVRLIRGEAKNLEAECRRYEDLLRQAPIDLVCFGIGENGHLAFNDPPADFEDPTWVKVVTLDEACRQQQVNDGCFPTLGDVPTQAITLTVPALLSARRMIGIVPDERKAQAVHDTLFGPITPDCPASILQTVPHATVYLDPDSASLLNS